MKRKLRLAALVALWAVQLLHIWQGWEELREAKTRRREAEENLARVRRLYS